MLGVRIGWTRALIAAAACALALAACGSDDGKKKAGTDPDVPPVPNQPALQALTCRDWTNSDAATRESVLSGLEGFVGSPVTGKDANGQGSILTREQGRALLDGQCSRSFARGFSLYKLYGQAAGFAGHAPGR